MINVGFLVGRFQAPYLHDGYIFLIKSGLSVFKKFSIVLSKRPIATTERNPFTIEERKAIITSQLFQNDLYDSFAGFVIVEDRNSDKLWSSELDKKTLDFMSKFEDKSHVLFGSRDSFIPYYSGSIQTIEFEPYDKEISSTEIRKRCVRDASKYYDIEAYAIGKIVALSEQFPTSYSTVDIAILSDDMSEVLLGRKPFEEFWRFPGGFVDPTDPSLEMAAKREAHEECLNIEISDPQYIASVRIDDWRYRSEQDKILTSFFWSKYIYGNAKAGDDLEEVQWFKIEGLDKNMIGKGHQILFAKLEEFLKNKKD